MEADKQGFFKETQHLLEQYVKERLLLLKLETAEKAARLVAVFITGLIIALFSFLVLLFLSVMAGYFLAELTGSMYYGFGIVTAFYFILLALSVYFRKTVLYKYISDSMIRILFERTENTADE